MPDKAERSHIETLVFVSPGHRARIDPALWLVGDKRARCKGCDAFNVNGGSGYSNEQGDSIYFHVDDWIESASKPAYPAWGDHFRQAHEHMRASLAIIATFSRVKE